MKTNLPSSETAAEALLSNIRIASPCSASWAGMKGDDRVRFCGQCQKNVYNLAEMPAAEAAGLVRKTEGKLCVRMYQRPDETLLADEDCPVGLARAWRWTKLRAAAMFAAMMGLAGLGGCSKEPSHPTTGKPAPVTGNVLMGEAPMLMGVPGPSTNAPPRELLGDMCFPSTSTNQVEKIGLVGKIPEPPPVKMGKIAPPAVFTNQATVKGEIDVSEIKKKEMDEGAATIGKP